LAGTEEPYEYYGEASLEGFYIVSSLKQLEVCVKNYNNYKGTTVNEIVDTESVKEYNTLDRKISGDKWWGTYATNKTLGVGSEFYTGIKMTPTTSVLGMYTIMKNMLNWGSFTAGEKGERFTKLVSIVNLRGFVYPDKDEYKPTNKAICDATESSLIYAQGLLGDQGKPCNFGRQLRRLRSGVKRRRRSKKKVKGKGLRRRSKKKVKVKGLRRRSKKKVKVKGKRSRKSRRRSKKVKGKSSRKSRRRSKKVKGKSSRKLLRRRSKKVKGKRSSRKLLRRRSKKVHKKIY
jgi:hypothetical protein